MDIRTHLSLCSGYGGIDLGLTLAFGGGIRTRCYVERDSFAAAALVARMEEEALDPAPIWDDLTSFHPAERVDVLSAGFPCQPFSTASRGRRTAPDLWPHVRRVICQAVPKLVVLENVQRAPIEQAGEDLARIGYTVTFDPFDAAELGASSPRRRWWLLAHHYHANESILPIDAEVACVPQTSSPWASGPAFLGVHDGTPYRVDRSRLLGNGVAPLACAHAVLHLSRKMREHLEQS